MTSSSAIRRDLRRTPSRVLLVAALLAAAVGILIQFLTGVPGFPAIPPGPIILGMGAVIVAVVPWRWVPVLGLLLAAFITVGMVAAGTGDRLLRPSDSGPFIGTWVQLVGLIVALFAGIVCIVLAARSRRSASKA
jgi:hypothetical protein